MRNLVFFLSLFISFPAFSQWKALNAGTEADLYSISFPTSKIGYAAGWNNQQNYGVILKTEDGGKSWRKLDSSMSLSYGKAIFFDENKGIVTANRSGSRRSFIYRTTDGGQNWDSIPIGSHSYSRILDLYRLDDNNLYLLAIEKSYGLSSLFISNDYGLSWNLVSTPDSPGIAKVFFLNKSIGFAWPKSLEFKDILKTMDGGRSWNEIDFPTYNRVAEATAFNFTDSLVGFSGGWYSGHLMKTKDGGHTWSYLAIDNNAMPTVTFIKIFGNSVYAGAGKLFRSDDLGETWKQEQFPTNDPKNPFGIYDMHIFNKDTAIAVGINGMVLINTSAALTGIAKNIPVKEAVKIFPNPARNTIVLESLTGGSVQKVEIIDLLGRTVWTGHQTQMDISGLDPGAYLLRVWTEEGTVTQKIIVE